MRLDIRLPIGMLFSILGLLLAGYGAVSDRAIYQRSLGFNVNLSWGLVLFAFGVFMLVLGRRGFRSVKPTQTTADEHAIEQSDQVRGTKSDVSR